MKKQNQRNYLKESKETWTDNEIILELCHMFAKESRFQFPGYTEEDIYQEAYIIGMNAIDKFRSDGGASRFTYLYRSIYNRLTNLKRDKYLKCGKSSEISEKIHNAEEITEDMLESDFFCDYSNLFEEIDKRIPADLRDDWRKMKERTRVSHSRKQKILDIVHDFCEERIYG